MKKTAIFSSILLIAAVVTPVRSRAPASLASGPAAPQAGGGERQEMHPEIRAALRHLNQARESLAHAAHDFGGHRAKALELTDSAIRECREALEYDKH